MSELLYKGVADYVAQNGYDSTLQFVANPKKDKKLLIRVVVKQGRESISYIVEQFGTNVIETKRLIIALDTYDNI